MFLISGNFVAQCPLNLDETSTPPTNNLLLHLPLNNDLSNLGYGNYSFNLSGAGYVNTQCGQGLYFDGEDDFLEISPSMNLVNDFTVTAWITPDNQVDWMGIFSIREQCSSTYRGYSIVEFGLGNYNVNTLSNQVNSHQNCIGYSGGDRYTDPNLIIPNGVETFVALTVQNNHSENRSVQLYVNCEALNVSTIMDISSSDCFNSLLNLTSTIGATSPVPGFTNTFHGIIDEVRVYGEALNYTDIISIYRSCLPISVEVENFQNCANDSAQITLFNPELDIEYQLVNTQNGTSVGPTLTGICDPLVFSTGVFTDTSYFQIYATNTITNCTIPIDSIFTLFGNLNGILHSESIELCLGDSINIGNQTVTQEGIYTDTIELSSFCDSIIYYDISIRPSINLNLGSDTTLCLGDWIVLSQSDSNWNNEWWDGTDQYSSTITEEGIYWLTASNDCYTVVDSIEILFEDCNCSVYTPNSFTPNGDGINDYWHPKYWCHFDSFILTIYNRWGEIIHTSNDPSDFWDGTHKGSSSPNGVYVYDLKYSSSGKHNTRKKGHIVLIR